MPATPVRPPAYRRREPEKEPLYQILAGHLETFLQHTRTSEHQLPLHVEKEMRAYLDCGILAYGFVRALKDPATGVRTAPLCFASRGFSLHAATRIAGPDRRGLERLCRYVARPPLASGRLRLLASQRLCFALKTPWSDGTRHLLLSPMELLEKLAALVPPPRLHLLCYHGVLAPRARDRGRIVPTKPVAEPAADGDTSAPSCTHRLGWAALLARVFSSDLSACATCGGRLRIVVALTDPASIRTYLEGIGLPAVPPPRAPPQPQFEFAA